MMRILLTFIISLNLYAQLGEQIKTTEVNVGVGIDKVLDLDFEYDTDVILGDDTLLTVRLEPLKKKITIVGVKEGNTSLTVKDKSGDEKVRYAISITADDQTNTVTQIRDLLQDVEGIEVGIKGGKVFVGGYIVKPSDIGIVSTVLDNFEGVLRLVEMHPQTQQIIARKLTEEFQKFNLKNITVRIVNQSYWIEGVVSSAGEKTLLNTITDAFLPDRISSLSADSERVETNSGRGTYINFASVNADQKKQETPLPKQIKISTQFVELSKDYSKVFGLKWAPTFNGDGGSIGINGSDGEVGAQGGTFTAAINNLIPKMQSLKNAGYGRVIQSGMVIVVNKKTGNINKNTEIPFSEGSGENQNSATATVGFNLTVTPEILQKENVNIVIPNLSVAVTTSTTGTGSPITTKNSLKTELFVKSGQSAVVGGVVQNQDVTGYDKNDPAAYDEDTQRNVFFNFLRSKSKSISKNQYVVFITPEIIESAAQDTAEIRRKFKRTRR